MPSATVLAAAAEHVYGFRASTPEDCRGIIPRDAMTVFKNHCDHTFGGQTWFDVLNQTGGCPVEFVDAWNAVTNQRLQVAF